MSRRRVSFDEAERLLAYIRRIGAPQPEENAQPDGITHLSDDEVIALAQVHATLAHTEATEALTRAERAEQRVTELARTIRELGYNPDCVGDCLDGDACTCPPECDGSASCPAQMHIDGCDAQPRETQEATR